MFSGFYYYCYSPLALALGRRLKVGRPSGARSSTASPLGGYLQSLVKRAAITTGRMPSLHVFPRTMLQGAGRLLPHSTCKQKSPLRERRDCRGVGLVQRPTGVSQPPFRSMHWSGLDETNCLACPLFWLNRHPHSWPVAKSMVIKRTDNKMRIRHGRVDRVKWKNALFPGFWRP